MFPARPLKTLPCVVASIAILAAAGSGFALSATEDGQASALIGVWRGTSTCTDRVAAPACNDEVVVYEFTAGAKSGIVRWKADKVVNQKRETMGEMDLSYDKAEACWRAEFTSPRVKSVWCLRVERDQMKGRAWLLPGHEVVRKVEARKDQSSSR